MPATRARLALETVSGDRLHFVATTDKGLTLALDTGPQATAPNPMEALLAALGACSGMDVMTILRKKRQQVTGYTIELVGQRLEEHPRSYTSVEIVHRVTGKGISPAAVEEALRLSETKYCSVHATLSPGLPITSRFEVADDSA
jgi:putative redox protein